VLLGRNTVVENIVDADGPVFVRHGVIVGTGEKGGIASGNTVYVELGFSGKTKIYASKGVKVVKDVLEILPEDLKQIIGKKREQITPVPLVISVKHPEVRRVEDVSPEREIWPPLPYAKAQAPKAAEEEKTDVTAIEQPKHVFFVPKHKTADETDAIFRSFEDRIRDFGKAKESQIEKVVLKELREHDEVNVYNLAAAGYGVNEIGLRLLMDPFKVQGILNTLIAKGSLDEKLKPKKRETEKPKVAAPETVQETITEEETEKKQIYSTEEASNSTDGTHSSDDDQSNSEDIINELREL